MSLRDELPIQTLSSFSVKHDEIARLQAEVDAYLAAGGRIDIVPACKVVSDISPAKREKMLEASIRGQDASLSSRGFGRDGDIDKEQYCTQKDAAKILGINYDTFKVRYKSGKIPLVMSKKTVKRGYFLKTDVLKLKQEWSDVL